MKRGRLRYLFRIPATNSSHCSSCLSDFMIGLLAAMPFIERAREVWLVEDAGGVTRLTVETYDVPEGGRIHTDFQRGFIRAEVIQWDELLELGSWNAAKDAGKMRTKATNRIKHILRRHNLQWEMPTKRFPTLAAVAWLEKLVLPEIDRLEMDHLLADLKQVQKRIEDLEKVIGLRCAGSEDAALLATIPGVAAFTATSLACGWFPRLDTATRSLWARFVASYWRHT